MGNARERFMIVYVRARPREHGRHNGRVVLFDPHDELSELIPLEEAPAIAQVSARTLRRWIADRRLRVLAGHVVERELLAVEKERWESRRAGRPGARPVGVTQVSRAGVTGVTPVSRQGVTGCDTACDL